MVSIVRLFSILVAISSCAGAVNEFAGDPLPDDYWGEGKGRPRKVQKKRPAILDAVRAPLPPIDVEAFRTLAETRTFRLGGPETPQLTPDGNAVLFLEGGPRDARQTLYKLDIRTGETRILVTPEALAKGSEVLSPQERARRERMRVTTRGITSFEITGDGLGILVPMSGRLFFFDRMSGQVRDLPTDEGTAFDPQLSPDGKLVAFVRNNDVRVIATDAKSTERGVTRGGTDARPHGVAEFVAAEEFDRPRGFFWSPDSESIAFEEPDQTKMERLSISDPAHPEREPDHSYYPRVGTPNAELRFGVASVKGTGAVVWVDWDRMKYPYVATVRWERGAPLTLYALDRAQRHGALLAVDTRSGKTRVLLTEQDDAWLNVDSSVPRWMPDGSTFYWSTERNGAWELEERQVKKDGGETLGRTFVPKESGYRELLDVDPERKRVVFAGGTEPSERTILSVPMGGGNAEVVDAVTGLVDGRFGVDHVHYLAHERTATTYPKWVVRSVGKSESRELPSVAEKPPWSPTPDLRQVGADRIRVVVTRPHGMVAGRKYPVVDAAYGGPHANVATTDGGSHIRAQFIADAVGAIVVEIDAKGTPGRTREWERAIAGKLDEVPILGHIEAIKALGTEIAEIDVDHVGVYGWSFGGTFSAAAVLSHPEFYKVGVAGAPVVDWRDYDTAYTERYMGLLPEAKPAYDAQSLLTMAATDSVSRPLLIIHGTADDNVYFLHGLKLADTLTRAHKAFEFLPLLGQTHLVSDPVITAAVWIRTAQFLRDGLLLSDPGTGMYRP